MENNSLESNRADAILEKIKNNELTIRPKNYFRLKLLALLLVALMSFIVSTFLFSFIFFSLRASGEARLFGFGSSGIAVFLLLFPWKLFFFDLLLMIILGYILRSFRFGYKSPVLRLLLAVFLLMILFGMALDLGTSLHRSLLWQADRNQLPLFGDMYERVRRPEPPPRGYGIYRGIISSVSGNMLSIDIEVEDPAQASSTIMTVFLPESEATTSLMVGDRVLVAGSIYNGELHSVYMEISPPPEEE